MSIERDELAALIESGYGEDPTDCPYDHAPVIADAILAAGYRAPRTITTVEELDALPAGSMVLDSDPDVCRKNDYGSWISISDPEFAFDSKFLVDSLPATLIHEGTTK